MGAAAERINKLRELINHHRYQYHVLDKQEISDEALDSLKDELAKLEAAHPELVTPDSPTQRVAGKALEQFAKVTHRVPQWSFNDAFTLEDIQAFHDRVTKGLGVPPAYTCELKIDGFKVVLRYEKGILVNAATRGDGRVGEDVTMNVRTIESVPLRLAEPVDVVVEGEIWLGKKDFAELNEARRRAGEPLFANPRNCAAGTIRQLDPRVVARRRLQSFVYDLAQANFVLPATQYTELQKLQELGFRVEPHFTHCPTLESVVAYWQHWQERAQTLDYSLDGVVVKVDERAGQERLGYTGKGPRFAIAFKFRAEEVTTVVEAIDLQVGRTGVITPVAHLRPVFLAGSTVSRATLHNEDEIKRLDVRVGDTVVLRKAGDIIPDIISALPELRTGQEKPFIFPKTLAACGGPIERIPGQAAYRCVNQKSAVQVRRKLVHFASKSAFDIEGLGPKVVDLLMDNGLVGEFTDFFTLERGDLLALPRFAEKSADNLLAALKRAQRVTLARLLVALSINHVGEETAEDLAQAFRTLASLREASEETLAAVPGIGPVVAASVHSWFHTRETRAPLERLLKHITIAPVAVAPASGALAGRVFVFTGTLNTLTRDTAKKLVLARGGRVAPRVSGEVTHVVAGAEAGSKLAEARRLGIAVLTESEFLKLVEQGK